MKRIFKYFDTHNFEHGVFRCGCLPKRQTTTTTPLNFHFSFILMFNLGQSDPGTLLKNLLYGLSKRRMIFTDFVSELIGLSEIMYIS